MLDLTSFRRKDRHAQSITVMRELYHEYNRNQNTRSPSNDVDAITKKTISVEKFNNCFQQILSGTTRQSTEYLEPTRTFSKAESRQSVKQSKYNMNKQRGSFKSQFSQTVSLFNPHPAIKRLAQASSMKQNKVSNDDVQKVIKKDFFSVNQPNVRNPTNLFIEMKKAKQEQEEQNVNKKRIFRVVRHNWIVSNLYHCKSAQNVFPKFKNFDKFQTTKENIFPALS